MFYRTIRMMENGIKPVYVFDGKPPNMKSGELEKRTERRAEAQKGLEEATEKGDTEAVEKFNRRLVKVTKEQTDQCVRLLRAMVLLCNVVVYFDLGHPSSLCTRRSRGSMCWVGSKGESLCNGHRRYGRSHIRLEHSHSTFDVQRGSKDSNQGSNFKLSSTHYRLGILVGTNSQGFWHDNGTIHRHVHLAWLWLLWFYSWNRSEEGIWDDNEAQKHWEHTEALGYRRNCWKFICQIDYFRSSPSRKIGIMLELANSSWIQWLKMDQTSRFP